MKILNIRRAAAVLFLGSMLFATILFADAPPLPLRVYGELPGLDAGATISARVNDTEFASSTSFLDGDRTVYVVDVPGDDPSTPEVEGAVDGAAISFRIDGIDAEETVNWSAGLAMAADLHRVPTAGGPEAQDQSLVSLEDVPLAVTLRATDPDDQPLTFQIVGAPQHGTINGTPPDVTYRPDADWNGIDSFTFEASDGTDTDLGTITITVDPVPDAPRLDPIADVVVVEGSELTIPITAVDPDGHVITLEAAGLPAFAELTVTGNGVGELSFAPAIGDAGSYGALSVTATDNVYVDQDFFVLVVEPLTGPPIADDLGVTTAEDQAVAFELSAIDPDGDPITYQITVAPEHGTVEGTAPSLTYVPGTDFFGTDTLTYTASDASETSQPATVTFTVDPVVDAPRLNAVGDQSLNEGETLDLTIIATDPDGDPVQLSASGLPAFASFVDGGDGTGSLEIQPGFDDAGSYPGIEITASDGALVDTEVLTLTVDDYQAPPTASFRPAKGMNVAQLGSATVQDFSSQYSVNGPERAIDGLANTLWRSNSNADEWMRLRLPGDFAHVIGSVVLRGRGQSSGARNFELWVSTTDGTDNDFVLAGSGEIPQDNLDHEFLVAPAQARRVELRIADNWGHASVTDLYNFELWTRNREGGIVSLVADGVPNGAAVADYSSERQDPERAFDLSDSYRWESANGQITDQWLTVGLTGGQAHWIDRVRLVGPSIASSPRHFEIRVSTVSADPAGLATVFTGELPAGGQPHWFFFEPVQARYVQLFIHDTHGDIGWVGVASFDVYSPDLGSPTVPFDDQSFDADGTIVDWSWDFGDGAVSTERHPVHTYSVPGTYTVSLTVTDDQGQSSQLSRDYTVLEPPTPAFTWTPASVVEGDLVRFADLSTDADGPILAWHWTFHEGSVRTADDPAWTYTDDGSWPVTLRVTDSQLLTATVTLEVPVANAAPSLNLIPPAGPVVWGEIWIPGQASATDPGADDQANLLCHWDYGDGNTLDITACYGTDPRLEYVYDLPGTYTATLTVTDSSGENAVGSFDLEVQRRPSRITLIGHGDDPANQESTVRARLLDNFELDLPLEGRTVTFRRGAQAVDAVTDASGEAEAVLTLLPDDPDPIVVEFAGDALYLADSGALQATGTVLAGIGDGEIFVYDANGQLLDVLNTTSDSNEQSGMCFDPDGRILTTNFATIVNGNASVTYGSMSRFDRWGNRLDAVWTGVLNSEHPESCVVDSNGFVYVGSVDADPGDPMLRQYDLEGQLLASFTPEVEDRGIDWIDLAADRCTLFYTSEGSRVLRFDVCTGQQLPDFASGLDDPLFALRIRPNGEVMVASWDRIYRLSPTGQVMATYLDHLGGFFGLNLDPDGTSFWTAVYHGGQIYRVDIETGQQLSTFQPGPLVGPLSGLAVVGELTAASNRTPEAEAGDDQLVTVGETVVLDGSASSDPDVGDALTYTWSQVSGPAVGLTGDDTATASFTPSEAGTYVFELTVDDGSISATDTVTVTAEAVPGCAVYPFATDWTPFHGVAIDWQEVQISIGTAPGQFSWLSWLSAEDSATLANSLTPPGDSHTYVHPVDPTDTVLSTGDWVHIVGDQADEQILRDALDALIGQDIVIPIWDLFYDGGTYQKFRVGTFVGVRVVGYDLTGSDTLTVNYLGEVSCPSP